MAETADITVSVPGSLMLLGEHAVLHGHKALVGAINRRITAKLFAMPERTVSIHSALGEYQSPLDDLQDHPSFRFVLQAIRQHLETLPAGFKLEIESDFSADIGFGSSAAVTIATHAAILKAIRGELPQPQAIFNHSLQTVQTVQGRGSGADLAASLFGGIVGYSILPEFHPVEITLPLTAVYCGYKTPTPEVILTVEQNRVQQPEIFERIFSEIDTSVDEAIQKLMDHDLPAFGKILSRNQRYMEAMGVNTPELAEIVNALENDPEIFGAKISGSGLGDCAIGLGSAELKALNYPVHHLSITPAGCSFHE